jgi:uncharacterized protein (TIGR03435 family)
MIMLGLAAYGAAFGQAAGGQLQFEAASVKRSQPPANGGILVGGRGGPGSADPGRESERYDIVATIPDGATKEQFPMMLQNLLTERFGIALHHETRELPLYELSVAKNGPKLRAPAADPNARLGGTERMTLTPSSFHLEGHAETASALAGIIENQLASPVVDKTGLSGTFDFTLDFSRESVQNSALAGLPPPPPANPTGQAPGTQPAADPGEAPSLFTAIQEQLGLKLDKKRGPLDVIVVDQADKVPKEN